jgi:hypothetical protein
MPGARPKKKVSAQPKKKVSARPKQKAAAVGSSRALRSKDKDTSRVAESHSEDDVPMTFESDVSESSPNVDVSESSPSVDVSTSSQGVGVDDLDVGYSQDLDGGYSQDLDVGYSQEVVIGGESDDEAPPTPSGYTPTEIIGIDSGLQAEIASTFWVYFSLTLTDCNYSSNLAQGQRSRPTGGPSRSLRPYNGPTRSSPEVNFERACPSNGLG